MRSSIALVLVLLLAGVAAAFASVSSGVQHLDAAAAARITAIGTPPATKALSRESKNLSKARTKLALYTGQDTVAAFKNLAAAGRLVFASGTNDPDIVAALNEIVDGFLNGADNRLQNAINAASGLHDPAHIALLNAAVKAAKAYLEQGRTLFATNPLKAAPFLIKAYDLLGAATGRAHQLVTAEAGSLPPEGLTITSDANGIGLSNASTGNYDIQKIRVFAAVTTPAGGTVKTYTGQSLKSILPSFFAVKHSNRILPAGSIDLTPALTGLVPAGSVNPRVVGLFEVTIKGEPFFVLAFDVTFP